MAISSEQRRQIATVRHLIADASHKALDETEVFQEESLMGRRTVLSPVDYSDIADAADDLRVAVAKATDGLKDVSVRGMTKADKRLVGQIIRGLELSREVLATLTERTMAEKDQAFDSWARSGQPEPAPPTALEYAFGQPYADKILARRGLFGTALVTLRRVLANLFYLGEAADVTYITLSRADFRKYVDPVESPVVDEETWEHGGVRGEIEAKARRAAERSGGYVEILSPEGVTLYWTKASEPQQPTKKRETAKANPDRFQDALLLEMMYRCPWPASSPPGG